MSALILIPGKTNNKDKVVCNVFHCHRRRNLTFVHDKWLVCPIHLLSVEKIKDGDASESIKQNWETRVPLHQPARGHVPSLPLKRLPILDCEAAPPGGPVVATPIQEVFGPSHLIKK